MSEATDVQDVDVLEGTLLGQIRDLVSSSADDYVSARDNSNVAASRRVRGKMLEVKKLVLEVRKEMLASRPDKK